MQHRALQSWALGFIKFVDSMVHVYNYNVAHEYEVKLPPFTVRNKVNGHSNTQKFQCIVTVVITHQIGSGKNMLTRDWQCA